MECGVVRALNLHSERNYVNTFQNVKLKVSPSLINFHN